MSANHGRSTRRFKEQRRKFKQRCREHGAVCYHCEQPIDYDAGPDDPNSFNVDHQFPLSTHPHLAEDPANFLPSCAGCNKARGAGPIRRTLGETSRDW
ncbi:MAG: HNH endonuclease [Nocardioidaceae bacterium]|nr:MAG: HNH endonuclease [Nocardioidaceae bacterium]